MWKKGYYMAGDTGSVFSLCESTSSTDAVIGATLFLSHTHTHIWMYTQTQESHIQAKLNIDAESEVKAKTSIYDWISCAICRSKRISCWIFSTITFFLSIHFFPLNPFLLEWRPTLAWERMLVLCNSVYNAHTPTGTHKLSNTAPGNTITPLSPPPQR